MNLKILILENIHAAGLNKLKKNFDVSEHYGLTQYERKIKSQDYPIIVVKSVTKVDQEFIDECPQLKIVARAGTGLDNIDCKYAAHKGIQVLSVPTGNTQSAADFTLLLIIASLRKLAEVIERTQRRDYRRHLLEGRELSKIKAGILGLGNVGIAVARRLHSFDCSLKAYDPHTKHFEIFKKFNGSLVSSFEELIDGIDLLTIHCSLTKENYHLINDQFLNNLKKPLYLINTARGQIVDEKAIIKALNNGKLIFYASDLLEEEPPFDKYPGEHSFSNPLISHPRSLITPHMAASTEDAQKNISLLLADAILKHSSLH